jgi:hypothetical protein
VLQRYREQLGVGLFPLAALVVHQLRYELAFGGGASRELADQGHSYLHELTPWIVLAVAIGLGGLIARVARAWRSGEGDGSQARGLIGLWALVSVALFSLYVGQEFLEGLFATGHPQGLAGILGDGGWWALPAAGAVGALLTLVIAGGRVLVAAVAARSRRRAAITVAHAARLAVCRDRVALPRLAPLARVGAGRAPPPATPSI